MKTANYHHLSQLIGVVNTLEFDELPDLEELGAETACKHLAVQWIKPDYERLVPESKNACKNSLRYFLTTKNAPFEEILDNQQEFCWDVSQYGASFFEWIWEGVFPNEDYSVSDLEDWREVNEAAEAMLRSM